MILKFAGEGDIAITQSAQLNVEAHIVIGAAIECEYRRTTALFIVENTCQQTVQTRMSVGGMAFGAGMRAQHVAMAELGGLRERMKNCLTPRRTAWLGHDGANNVHELRQAGTLNAIGIV